MDTARFSSLVRDLPLEHVVAVIEALDEAGFWPSYEDGVPDVSAAINAARIFCNPAASPAPLNGPKA